MMCCVVFCENRWVMRKLDHNDKIKLRRHVRYNSEMMKVAACWSK